MRRTLTYLLIFILPYAVWGKLTSEELDVLRTRSATAIFLENHKIELDGKLDEPAWRLVKWESNFVQRNPNDGNPATYPTEFGIMYDENYLYVGARAYDPEPDKIISILSRRDDYTESDWMYVSIDSYNDNRTAFEFGLNAAGVKHDVRRFDDENMEEDWDAVWDGKTNIDDQGWTAEWRIPFRELRFSAGETMEWGLEFYRELPRHNSEFSVWNYWAHSEEGFVSRYGSLNGLAGIKVQRPIYVVPYVANQVHLSDDLVNSVHPKKYDLLYNLGGDIRYSSRSGLTLNATLNPDFGQVETDPADFNLTEFETYFPEKRPFFMEGANILRYSLGFGDGDAQNNSLFYSRRIGRAPQGYPITDNSKDVLTISRPSVTNILGAAKITGKTQSGFSLGVMEALTGVEKATVHYTDKSKEMHTIEPMTNYFLSRFQQDFKNGQTAIGGILSAVNRDLRNTDLNYLHKAAYTGGIDIDHKFANRNYQIIGTFAFSNVQGDTTAIKRTQKSASRYFQRVDADHLAYDPQATSLSGYAFKGIVQKNSGHVRGAFGTLVYSPGLEINDFGFLQNVDEINQFTWIQYREWEAGKLFREYRINLNQWYGCDFAGMRRSLGGNVNMHFTFNNNWNFGYGINHNRPTYDPSMNRGGPILYVSEHSNLWAYANTDARKEFYYYLSGFFFRNKDEEPVESYEIEQEFTWRPRQNLKLTASVTYTRLNDTWAWIGKAMDDNDAQKYVWASMTQNTFSLTFRTDYTITPTLSVQYYAQPYYTAGDYFDYVFLADSKNKNYWKRFNPYGDQISYDKVNGVYAVDRNSDGNPEYTFNGQPDFNYKQFRSNLVIRWEYMTGSVMYLVWSQGFTNYELFRSFNFGKDTQTLFNGISDNVFMIKISQMLTF